MEDNNNNNNNNNIVPYYLDEKEICISYQWIEDKICSFLDPNIQTLFGLVRDIVKNETR